MSETPTMNTYVSTPLKIGVLVLKARAGLACMYRHDLFDMIYLLYFISFNYIMPWYIYTHKYASIKMSSLFTHSMAQTG